MDGKKPRYIMHRLMNYPELDAFSAHKKAGSDSIYFDLLTEFMATAPNIVAELKAPRNNQELLIFLGRINALQKLLLAVGSPTLMWLAEKAIEAAKSGNDVKCEDEIFTLSSRLQGLCVKLDEAKVDATSGGKIHPPSFTQAAASPPKKAVRPQAPIKAELFEKLNTLVENFERDDALKMLRSLLGFTFSRAIDPILFSIFKDLTHFDYDDALAHCQRLLEIARDGEGGTAAVVKKKILAIDDVPDVLNTVKAVLKDSYAVYGVTNHMAALKFLTSNVVDLILLDIEMPDMNGFALLGIIRKIKAYENTPVVFLTGNVSVENVHKAHDAGGNDFVRKPIEASVLLAKIGKLCG